ncbi:MAG: Fur family transcriptional regulator [Pseudomonadota bacterium]
MAKRSKQVIPGLTAAQQQLAEDRCAALRERLTPARLTAYAEIVASGRPLSAYELIALLEAREARKIAPLTVYRHLEFLMRVGLVHRLESKQAYLACDHPEYEHESQYLLCSACGKADEIDSKQLGNLLDKLLDQQGFKPVNTVVEVTGYCSDCSPGVQD